MENMRHMYGRNDRNMCDCNTPYDKCKNARAHHSNNNDSCHHDHCDHHIENMPIGMAYVPWQEWRCVYDGMEGLKAGTIFQELEMPYYGQQYCCGRKGEKV